MKKLIALFAVLLLWSTTALFTVDQAEYAYVTQFGRPVATLDGATDAGLHVKLPWPVQSVLRLDRRVQPFGLPPAGLPPPDPPGPPHHPTPHARAAGPRPAGGAPRV